MPSARILSANRSAKSYGDVLFELFSSYARLKAAGFSGSQIEQAFALFLRVFCGSCGRTDLPTGSMSQMRDSLHRLFELLPPETEIFPGHGEETDAAFEKAHNPYL